MFRKDDKVFLRIPKEDTPQKRALRPGIVLRLEDEALLVQLENPCSKLEVGADVFLNFEDGRNFLQQSARILRKDSEKPVVVALRLQGSPVCSEARQCFRVSCLGANVKVTVLDEVGCEVIDISANGLAFFGTREYSVAREVPMTLHYDRKSYSGIGIIQSARRMSPKLVRYGVSCANPNRDELAKALAAVNLAVQGEQARRMRGTKK